MTTTTTESGFRLPLIGRVHRPRHVWQWVFLLAFAMVGLESLLIAFAWKREMLVLLAPGIICLGRAWETWKQIHRSGDSRQSPAT